MRETIKALFEEATGKRVVNDPDRKDRSNELHVDFRYSGPEEYAIDEDGLYFIDPLVIWSVTV